jgi:hypothetical protein
MQANDGASAPRKSLPAGFFALLIFLGSADQTFATRLGGMNFRWGQLLMLVALGWLAATGRLTAAVRALPSLDKRDRRAIFMWAAFFVVYLAACFHSNSARLTGMKLLWAGFNIGGAALICLLGAARPRVLKEGLVVGCALICGVIWIDSIALLWAGLPGPVLGLAQDSLVFEHVLQMRPHAFYYEPSYAGAALAFVTPLLFIVTRDMPRWVRWAAPTFTIATTVLTSARTGLLGLFVALGALTALALFWGAVGLARRVVGSGLLALVILTAFFAVTPRAGTYGRFILGPLGPSGIYERLTSSKGGWRDGAGFGDNDVESAKIRRSSEEDRLGNLLKSVHHWRERFVLGWGVDQAAPAVDTNAYRRAIRPQVINTWLEVANESGVLGLLSFGAAIALTIIAALRRSTDATTRAALLAAWTAHLVCNLNFTQTFPRLDYWLIFFCAARFALPDAQSAQVTTQPADAPTPSHDMVATQG